MHKILIFIGKRGEKIKILKSNLSYSLPHTSILQVEKNFFLVFWDCIFCELKYAKKVDCPVIIQKKAKLSINYIKNNILMRHLSLKLD
ncbi:MAG: hypothetical protein D6734_02295 [Candidatus Schekmanbacteria bacterium]|nr:MAG: hypothetical protein D6734_02295 [Candidatus Schekmanbacteria bacterium]